MKSKILYITCAIMIFVTIYEITNTYGLFESNINMNADSKLATWNILINDTKYLFYLVLQYLNIYPL